MAMKAANGNRKFSLALHVSDRTLYALERKRFSRHTLSLASPFPTTSDHHLFFFVLVHRHGRYHHHLLQPTARLDCCRNQPRIVRSFKWT